MANRPLKILHVVFFLEPGGMENGVVNITRALDPAEFEVHFCCLERPGAFVERLPHPENVHVLGKKPGFSVKTVLDLAKLIAKLKPHVIHSHNLGPLIYSGISSAFGTLCPVLQGEHSLLTPDECSPRRLRQRRILYRGCRKVHTVSKELRDQLLQLGFPPAKVEVIVNGVDTTRFIPADKQTARKQINLGQLDAKAFVIGMVGRFGAFKRHSLLIDAFNEVAAERPDLHLLLVGDGGPESARVRDQGQKSPVSNRIHFAGFQQDVRPYYQAMDLLVVPSVNEGLSNAILEGMACSLPVLANQVCGNAEVIHHKQDGLVADLDTAKKLAEELKNVLAVPSDLAKMGQMARENVVSRFSIKRMVEQYETLYRNVALTR